jgi:hypothetical protein
MHHLAGSLILLIFLVVATAAILLVLHLTKLGRLIHQQIPDRPHRRLLLASVSFFITFLAVRLLVASITHHIGPFGYVEMGGRHIHHLVWGILLLLIVGYATLVEAGTDDTPLSILVSRLLSLGYGIGAALTLDEFALWLNLDAMAYCRGPVRRLAGNGNLGRAVVPADSPDHKGPSVTALRTVAHSAWRLP